MDNVWYNRALYYYHTVQDKGFTKEFSFCRRESGIIKPYVIRNKDTEGNTGNI